LARRKSKTPVVREAAAAPYRHPEAHSLLRPEVGTQTQFRKKKAPAEYRYDSSLSPALAWDGQNGARELGAWLIACIEEASRLEAPHRFDAPREFRDGRGRTAVRVASLADAVAELKRIERPFLDWAGKAERLSFEVPTLPLFVHERLSTKAILETLKGHRRDKQGTLFDLYGDPEHSITDQVLRAYEHQDKWVNRMILGDSLVVMNSLLQYEGIGGQVQMIYIDPPYGVKFGSNFQPFVRKRDVKHGKDEDMWREPETVKAYRDTWELGLHSYLTYLRDRLILARELLSPTGSVFVQISDENLHHVRELMDEVFGADNACTQVAFTKTTGLATTLLADRCDYLLWYAKDRDIVKYRQLFTDKVTGDDGATQYDWVHKIDGTKRRLALGETPELADRLFHIDNASAMFTTPHLALPIELEGRQVLPPRGRQWQTTQAGMARLRELGRLLLVGNSVRYVRYLADFPVVPLNGLWTDTGVSGYGDPKLYVVQTNTKVVQRCLLMSTDPGDLVLDPTCGSGTTAFVAEQWGRRWITADTSRVPLALARQRLLTATFPYYELKDDTRGPVGGLVYDRKQNRKGEEVGGIVPHVTLKNLANDEPPAEEVLVDRPEVDARITRISGPFVVEGTIPAPIDWDCDGEADTGSRASAEHGSHVDRMLEVLRRSPVLHLGGNRTATLSSVRPPAKSLSLSAEAVAEGVERPVAIVFGPENGAIAEKLVYEAAREAHAKGYAHLYVIGFAISANARKLIDACDATMGVAATYVQCTPDLMMGDLLKNLRSSQIFSVCGLPEVALHRAKAKDVEKVGGSPKDGAWYQAELLGLDVFDPAEDAVYHRPGSDVPCWMVDADYNGLCFKATQVFFPRTSAWSDLQRALKGQYDDSVWSHLAGSLSAPFQAGEHRQVAVKVIDDRGNELLVVKDVGEAQG
jgi:adenine-specific DNA-methyltransferase